MRSARYRIGKRNAEFYGYIHDDMTPFGGSYRKRPAVIVFPGGGYTHLSIREEDPAVFPLFSHGYNVFVLKYSLGEAIRDSAPEMEAALAVKTLRSDSGMLDIDPDHIAVMGFSAGGHAAASISCHWKRYGADARPDAALLCYPVIDMGRCCHEGSRDALTGGDASLIEYYSLQNWVDDTTPPSFIWHTFTDEAVDPHNSLLYAEALHDHGVECELHIYSRGIHGLSAGYRETGKEEKGVQSWLPLALSWLDRLWGFER